MRPKGSAGGQKGVQSIIEQLKTDQIPRLSMGVGPIPKVCDIFGRALITMSAGNERSQAICTE